MLKIRSLVVDDEPVARKGIATYVAQTPFLDLSGMAKSAIEAGEMLQEEPVDLLFLDIQMPELTGIEFMRSLVDPPAVIFTTAYRDYAAEGFELAALDYLVKPISLDRFTQAAEKALAHFEAIQTKNPPPSSVKKAGHFFIKSDGVYIKIKLEDILYFESERDYVFIYTKKKRYLALLSLKQLERELPSNKFLRVHRSFIVATDFVEALEGNLLHIKESKVPVSRSMQEKVFKKLVEGKLWKRDM